MIFLTMGFYDLSKGEREELVRTIESSILHDFQNGTTENIHDYFSDEDTYIRKATYLAIGKIYKDNSITVTEIISVLD